MPLIMISADAYEQINNPRINIRYGLSNVVVYASILR
jgi:hypothetical protein